MTAGSDRSRASFPNAGEILRTLAAHDVGYVVIGGAAAVILGSSMTTLDIDITPDRTVANLNRLAAALTEMEATLLVPGGPPDGVPFEFDGHSLNRFQNASCLTRHGQIDCCLSPDGIPEGYACLIRSAREVEAFGVRFHVAALDDVIASKRAANRPKDLAVLPQLERLRRRTTSN